MSNDSHPKINRNFQEASEMFRVSTQKYLKQT